MATKFSSIAVYELRLTLKVPFTTSFGTYKDMIRPVVVARSTDGIVGYGEIPTLNDPAYKAESDPYLPITALDKYLIPSIISYQKKNKGFATIDELLKSYAWVKGAVFAKSGIEAAMWDILAKRSGKPHWKLWNGTQKEFIVGVSVGGKTIDDAVWRTDQAVSLGFKRIKVKVWPGVEEEMVKRIRKKYPKLLLQIDANSSYTLENWKLLKKVDKYDLLLIEQPLYDDDIVYHSEIAKELDTPVCLDESIHSLEDVKRAMLLWERNKIKKKLIINIKPPRVSGFSQAITIAKYSKQQGIKTWLGGMLETGYGKALNLQMNTLSEIDLPGDHFSPTGPYFEQDIVKNLPIAKNGIYKVSYTKPEDYAVDDKLFKKLSQKLFEQRL